MVDDTEVPADEINFPVFVDLATFGSDFWSGVQADGDDIRVTSGDGQTELPYDLVSFDSVGETGELHFLADNLSGSATTTFYFYYGSSTASSYLTSDPFGRNAVWVDYEAVYHFAEASTLIGETFVDSTGNGYTLSIETDAIATSNWPAWASY